MKRLLIVFLSLLLLSGAAQAGDVTVTHLTYEWHGPAWHDFLMEKAEEFEQLHPGINVEIIIGRQNKFDTMVLGGVAPDIMDLPRYTQLGPAGMLVDVRPLLERDGLDRAFNSAIYKSMIYPDGSIYSVPFELASTPTFFNPDLFAAAGLQNPIELGSRWTWNAMLDSAKKITKDANGDGSPEVFGIDRPWGYWERAVAQAGGKFYEFNENAEPVKSLWDSPEVLQGVEYVREFYRLGVTPHLHPGVSDQAQYYLWTGRTAFSVSDGMGQLGSNLKGIDMNWDFALQPAGPRGPIGHVGVSGPHILKSTKNLEETWQWAKFFALTKENVEDWVAITGRPPVMTAAQRSYATVVNIESKNFNAVFEQTMYPAPPSYSVDAELQAYKVDMNAVWRGAEPARNVVLSMHEKATAIIEASK